MCSFTKSAVKRSQMLKEWRGWACKIAAIAKEVIPGAEAYVVGSTVRGDSVGGSDGDVLIASEHIPEKLMERAKLKALIEEKLSLPHYHPFEMRMLRPEETERYVRGSEGCIVKVVDDPPH